VVIAGLVKGETAPSTFYVQAVASGQEQATFAQSCQQLALLAMTQPGQYLLTAYAGVASPFPSCKLSRASP
jgi:hypothetical protein